MDPATAFVALQAGSAVAGGLSARAQALDEAARLDSEARLAGTQALQRDSLARDDLAATLSSIRAARAANGLSATSPNAVMILQNARDVSRRDRNIEKANDLQRAANMRAAASSARRSARYSLITGLAKGGRSLAQGAYGTGRIG